MNFLLLAAVQMFEAEQLACVNEAGQKHGKNIGSSSSVREGRVTER